jgi:exodeoxyribonuclease VII small subunit
MAGKKKQSFETSLSGLEEIVSELESKEHELEHSLEMFEKGVMLYKDCKKHLEAVEKKITKLTDSLKEEDFVDE